MNPKVIAAIIALIGVVVSTIITFIISRKANRTSEEILFRGIEQDYLKELLKERLKSYPELYQELSSFIKIIEIKKVITRKQLLDLFTVTNQLNSRISILFSGETGKVYYDFWQHLNSTLNELNPLESIEDESELYKLRKVIQEIEISLKKDIGVYLIDFKDGEKTLKLNNDYNEISKKITERKHSS